MAIMVRRASASDAVACGDVIFAAFQGIADYHRFPSDFPSAAAATAGVSALLRNPATEGVVLVADGKVIGCNFIGLRPPVVGVGPIAVDPAVQNQGAGKRLMAAVLERAAARQITNIRLVQSAYHNRSLCLYTRLGFATRAPLSLLQGPPLNLWFAGYEVRRAGEADVAACNQLCREVHGFDRGGELLGAVAGGTAHVVEHLGRIAGYNTGFGFTAHAVAESDQVLMALIGAAPGFTGPGFLLPTQNHAVLDWCLAHGLRLVMQMTLMSSGLYQEPRGAWMPSVLY